MKKDKFLTDETQFKLKQLQNNVFELGFQGTQTMDIPFHISLGSFPIGCEEELNKKLKMFAKKIFNLILI